jgi:hypothetical protein
LGLGVSSMRMACIIWGNSSIPIVWSVLSCEEATVLVKVIWEKVHHKTICSILLGGEGIKQEAHVWIAPQKHKR